MVVQKYRSGADPRYESEGAQGGGGSTPEDFFCYIQINLKYFQYFKSQLTISDNMFSISAYN